MKRLPVLGSPRPGDSGVPSAELFWKYAPDPPVDGAQRGDASDCPMEISLLAGARQVTTVGRYAMPDYTTTFATLSLDDVLAAME